MADKKDFCAPYKKLIDALIDKHALEVTVHDLSEVSGFADIFIVAIARSELHGRTLKDTAMDTLDEMGFSYRIEGETSTNATSTVSTRSGATLRPKDSSTRTNNHGLHILQA